MKKISTIFLSLFIIIHLNAQDIKSPTPPPKPYYFQAGVSCLTSYVYGGRSDSLQYPYVVPTIAFHHKSGFYIDANLYYLVDKNNGGFDFLDINANYEFDLSKKLSGGIYATKYFYSNEPYVITVNINAMLGANVSYDSNRFVYDIECNLMIGSVRSDVWLSPSIEREFEFGIGKKWSVYPNFNLSFSSCCTP